MSFGLIVPQGWREDLPGHDFERLVEVGREAERLGFESIWLYDHLQTRAGDREFALRMLDEPRGARARDRQRSPILVGGAGEKVLLRLVAEHADFCNFTDSFDPAFYRHKLEVLRKHCETAGRDYAAIRKTASFTITSADAVDFPTLEGASIEDFIVYLDPPTDLAALERFANRWCAA